MTAKVGTTTGRWTRSIARVLVWLGLSFASWYLALWLFPPPLQGTFTGAEAEAASRAYAFWWWKFFALFVGVCVLVYEVAPRVWRWFRGTHGEVAG